MKIRNSLSLLAIAALFDCSSTAGEFVLRGTVPGALDSTKVTLAPLSDLQQKITGYVMNGKFELRGKSDQAACYSLVLDDRGIAKKAGAQKLRHREIHFFVENGELTFTTPHVDSLPTPPNYLVHDLRKEKHYKVTGSDAQDIFYAYQQQTIGLRYALDKLSENFRMTKDIDVYRKWAVAKKELESISWELVKKQQNLAVSLYVAEQLKKDPFMYDQAYLDELGKTFASCQDTTKVLRDFRQYLENAKVYNQGEKLKEAKVFTPEGDTISLLAQLKKGSYTVIDFWASHCGPCRASFPHLRKMYEKYGDRVKFISLSTDQKEEAWKRAMAEENLPWAEFRCGEDLSSKRRAELYQIRFIPTYLIVDPVGGIIFYSDNSGALELRLEELLK